MQKKQTPGAWLRAIVAVTCAILSCPAPSASGQTVDRPLDRSADAAATAQESLISEYEEARRALANTNAYNEYLVALIDSQRDARSALTSQLENYRQTKPEVVPLMNSMIESLGAMVESDLPFELDQRRARIRQLGENMRDSQMPVAEKLRQILDAYQAEMDYGRDIGATNGWIEANGPRRQVAFLRVGRIALLYQTQDRAETGFFNPANRQWEVLPDRYRSAVTQGLSIARKQAAPVLLRLPVAAPGVAE